jgi:hypothetical protein
MLEFIMDNPVLWNVKMTDYRRKDKKDKIWEEQAQQIDKTADTLKGWFRSLRDTHQTATSLNTYRRDLLSLVSSRTSPKPSNSLLQPELPLPTT